VLFQQLNSTSSNSVLATGTTVPASTNASTSPVATYSAPSAASGNFVSSGTVYFICAIAAVAALL
jgi:hypothetical protein